jgi:hypothetical protein
LYNFSDAGQDFFGEKSKTDPHFLHKTAESAITGSNKQKGPKASCFQPFCSAK